MDKELIKVDWKLNVNIPLFIMGCGFMFLLKII